MIRFNIFPKRDPFHLSHSDLRFARKQKIDESPGAVRVRRFSSHHECQPACARVPRAANRSVLPRAWRSQWNGHTR